MNRKKVITICLILVAVFLYLVASRTVEAVLGGLNVPLKRVFFLTWPEWVGIVTAVVAFVVTVKNTVAMGFLDECAVELLKVVYPTPRESGQSGIVVIAMVGIATLLLAVFDSVWWAFTRLILSVSGG